MIPKYIDDWLTIIENMKNENTYKLAWGRAIIECVCFDETKVDNINTIIFFDSIAEKMIKYYWNQLFFFKLRQVSTNSKEPVVCNDVYKLIEEYKRVTNSNIPVWYSEGIHKIKKSFYNSILKHVSKTLHENVSWRFKNVDAKEIDIYYYNHKEREPFIIIKNEDALLLKDYSVVISKLLNYRWSQLLEQFNYSPKIVSKVNSISNNRIKRSSLTKYKDQLLKEFKDEEVLDFYSGNVLKSNDISVDHVIPWSYMYSDDIWNLVLTSKSNNSRKSNTVPSEEIINKLKERNKNIENLLDDTFKNEMLNSINNNLVDKFYYDLRHN